MTAHNSRKAASGDVVLESRHLIALFVVMVVIFGAVFVLGYELGRNQYHAQVRAAAPAEAISAEPALRTVLASKPSPADGKSVAGPQKVDADTPTPTDWDFYQAADANPPTPQLDQPAKSLSPTSAAQASGAANLAAAKANRATSSAVAATKPAAAIKSATPSMDAPLIPHGTILLQVAALDRESDALAMAEVLEQKKFPTVIVPPGADKFYHIQVGPYRDLESAIAARSALENAGFKSIIKR
jgi:cell division protein FtsN